MGCQDSHWIILEHKSRIYEINPYNYPSNSLCADIYNN